jgi:hypothetical protein
MSAGNFVGAVIVAIPISFFLAATIIVPLDPKFQEEMRKRDEERTQARLVQERLDGDVASCLRGESPWKCFLKLETMDRTDPVPTDAGASRIRRLAKSVSAKEVLAFCNQPRKIDCAEQMIGDGYSRDDIQSALED